MNGIPGNGALIRRRFPADFLWGASTASYQIEGAVNEHGRGRSIWDTFSHTPGKVHGGDTGDIACDSYNRLDEDLALIDELGLGAYRFSVAWPRVQPSGRGQVNPRGLDYYRALLDGLLTRGVTPVLTVYHWDLPQALEDQGGWAQRDTAERFAEYAQLLAAELGDMVGMWITLNEPQVVAHQGYRTGTDAPGHRNNALAAAATHHLLLGHGLALQAMRSVLPVPAPIGIALDLHPIRAASEAAADVAVAIDAEQNGLFLDPVLHGCYPSAARPERVPPSALIRDHDMSLIGAPVDFLGINYYSPHYVRLGSWDDLRRGESPHEGRHGVVNYTPPEVPTTVMGWLIEPDGLFEVLTVVDSEAPHLPLYITENGCAADDYFTPEGQVNDFERIDYLHGHLDAASRAIEAGVNLKGYFVWSLMDNFEWSRGYKRRFGVYYVDYLTQRRLPKRSARFYADVVRTGALPAVEHQPTAVPVHAGPAV